MHDELVTRVSCDKYISLTQLLLITVKLGKGYITYDILIVVRDVVLANRVKVEQG